MTLRKNIKLYKTKSTTTPNFVIETKSNTVEIKTAEKIVIKNNSGVRICEIEDGVGITVY